MSKNNDIVLHPKKTGMLKALEECKGVVTPAAEQAGISRMTHYRWLDEDPKYRQAVEELKNVALDFAEQSLFERIKDKSDAALIFYLKTQGKKRGYVERQEVVVSEVDQMDDDELDEFIQSEIEDLAEGEKKEASASD